jgi:hypothetical protein
VIRGFELAVWRVRRIWLVVEAAIGEGAAESFMEEQKQERNVNAFGRQPVGVATAITLQKAMAFQLAQILAELVESVRFRGQLKRSENCLVNLFGRPAADGAAVVQEDLQQPDNPGVMDFDAGVAD